MQKDLGCAKLVDYFLIMSYSYIQLRSTSRSGWKCFHPTGVNLHGNWHCFQAQCQAGFNLTMLANKWGDGGTNFNTEMLSEPAAEHELLVEELKSV